MRTGLGTLITPVPEKYLEKINDVNVPLNTLGPAGVFAVKKGITSHFEMGYQLDFLSIKGFVDKKGQDIKVLTQAYTHTYQILYNFRSTNEFKPPINYFLHYKIGGVSLRNKILDNPSANNDYIKNVAVLTAIGGGINYQISKNLSLTGSVDLNRSSDSVGDLYQPQKLFYNSPNTVNRYMVFTGGISYWFNLSQSKKSSFFKARTETEKVLIQSKIIQHKGIKSKENKSDWYDHQRGK